MVVANNGDEECDHSSVVESVASGNQKMKNFVEMRVLDSDASLAVVGTSPEVGLEKGSILSDGVSVESGNQKRKSTVMADGLFEEAIALFLRMNVEPNVATIVSILKACAKLGRLEIDSAVMDIYMKCESVDDAMQVFDEMSKKDIVS
ncbi:hypothetical protein HN51_021468 [Arachis hypogaea]